MAKVCNVFYLWLKVTLVKLLHSFFYCARTQIKMFSLFSSPSVPSPASATEPDFKSKDWVFLNYTYKRFEGLTQRGTIPTYMKAGKAWRGFRLWCSGESNTDVYGHRVRAPPTAAGGARWCWRRRRQPLSINLTLITSYLGLLSRQRRCRRDNRHKLVKRRQEQSYRITSSRLYRIHVLSLAIALRPAHSLTRTLSVTCACSAAYCLCGGFSFFSSCIVANWGSRRKSLYFTTILMHFSRLPLMQPDWVSKEAEVPLTKQWCSLCVNVRLSAYFLLYS